MKTKRFFKAFSIVFSCAAFLLISVILWQFTFLNYTPHDSFEYVTVAALTLLASIPVCIILFKAPISRVFTVILSVLLVLQVPVSFTLKWHRDTEFRQSYVSLDSDFNGNARRFMPDLTEGEELSHIHSANTLEEWVYAKVRYNGDEYTDVLNNIDARYEFYEADRTDTDGTELITAEPLCPTRLPIEFDGFTYRIVKTDSIKDGMSDKYVTYIGTNDTEKSIVYLFAESECYSFMGAEYVLSQFLKHTP